MLAKRGFERVRLVDAADEIGGCMRWIPQLPGLDAWGRFVEWRRREIARLANLELATGVRLHADDVRASGADLVVVATGAHWSLNGFNGVSKGPIPGADATQPHILTPEQIMLGGKPVSGARVVVIDVESYHIGASLALRLAGQGHEVTIATPSETVAAWCNWTLEGPRFREQLHAAGVVMLSEVTPEEILPGAVRLQHAYGGPPFDVKADAIVLVTQRLSNEALYLELAGDRGRARGRRHRGRLPHRRLRRPALARRHGLRRPPPGPRDRQPEPRGLPADAARARPARVATGAWPRSGARPQVGVWRTAGYDPRCPAVRPGGTERSEAGGNPALSRNCDAPPGDEPGRLHRTADSSPRRKG